jgi:hypothetical protein
LLFFQEELLLNPMASAVASLTSFALAAHVAHRHGFFPLRQSPHA